MKKLYSILFAGLMCISGCKKDETSSSNILSSSNSTISQNTTTSSSTGGYSSSTSTSTSSSSSSTSTSSSTSPSTSISSSTSSSSSSSSSSSTPLPVYNLSSPSLMLNEENGVVTWEAVENAEYYNYVINDGEALTTNGTTLELDDKTNVSVQAVGENALSQWSNAVTYYDTSDVTVEGSNKLLNVYFHDSNIAPVQVRSGNKIDRPTNPTKDNYVFDDWYKDPFFTTLFDFNEPITESTVVYAHYNPTNFVDNTYYWIKANDKMSSEYQSSFTSDSGWRFIPLKESQTSSLKEFEAIVTVTGASTSTPCQFLVMDGIDDLAGRTYYKNGSSDFKITSSGTYKITFSVETLYLVNGNQVNAKFESINAASIANSNQYLIEKLDTPVVTVDGENNIAFISEVEGAEGYEVIINNGVSKTIKTNQVTLNKGEHITVRAVKGLNVVSNWSIPKANINYIYQEDILNKTHAYVYFYELNEDAEVVEINTYIDEPLIEKEGYNFLGWYLDLAKTKIATFPYLVEDNVVFYPKWEAKDDVYTKEYYEFVDANDNKISGLTWNVDNYEFYEYKTESMMLTADTDYYVRSLSTSELWGPYTVDESASYTVYFSEENMWDVNTPNAKNVYFALDVADIYFTNALYWSGTINAYYWNNASGNYYKAWPGVAMSKVKTNSYGQDIYKVTLDLNKYDYIIFNNGSSQTVNISLSGAKNNDAFYTKDEKSGSNYKVGTYTYTG